MDYTQSLQEAIRKAHGCESKHADSVLVEEVSRGKTVWKGTVEIFDLIGHPNARQCYAWGHAAMDSCNDVRIVTILSLPPADSPRKAVQVSILSDIKKAK